jgi:hypothetical protein
MRKIIITQILKRHFKDFMLENNFKILHGDSLVRIDNNVLQGIYFQPSAYLDNVNIVVFIQPLFVPADNIILSFGESWGIILERGNYWASVNEKDIKETVIEILTFLRDYALPWFDLTKSSCELLRSYEKCSQNLFFPKTGWNAPYMLGYCALDCGEFDKANKYFIKMKDLFEKPGFKAKWVYDRQ